MLSTEGHRTLILEEFNFDPSSLKELFVLPVHVLAAWLFICDPFI